MNLIKILKSQNLLDFEETVRTIASKINPYVFPSTIAINGVFSLYAIIKTFLFKTHRLWFASLSLWYLLMVSGKVQLFYKDGFTDEGMQIIKRTRFFMIAAGLTIVALSVQVYYFGFEVGLSVPFVVLNGSYIIIKLIFRFIKAFCSKGNKRKEIISAIDVCRQKLATAESMFAFSLIFFKLIDVYNWEDEMLSIMAMVYGGISGIAVIMLGVRRKKEQRVCTPKQPE